MQDFEKLGVFYLGREKQSQKALLYESQDLLTHAVCVGMTGSGKTGLCLALLEEAALDGIPALIVDPKGDLSNLLLTFPDLRGEDFRPWVNEDEARAKGISADQFAADQAAFWKQGLAEWGQDGDRIRRLRDSADVMIYTPGSDAGMPLSLLRSFDAPDAAILDDRESLRDRLTSTVLSLLSLACVDGSNPQSRDVILLSMILESVWRNGRSLDLAQLIGEVQKPGFDRIGVLDLETYYPAKERFSLVLALNNLIASPGFSAWTEGEPLNIDRLLYAGDGHPKLSILSIAHLSETERMFFVSLLLNETLAWVRRQGGTTSLRAIFYMDEIFGYFPPVANPPSKKPLLTLLKQARAYGLGVVLATQNPVDLDYKGLANTGTWMIGRLQTERDKARVLEGLEGAVTAGGGSFDRAAMEQTLAGLGKRTFLLNNVHEERPILFESRWAMSYLRGPLGKPEIRRLMGPVKASAAAGSVMEESSAQSASNSGMVLSPTSVAAVSAKTSQGPGAAPVVPAGITQVFLPLSGDVTQYEPCVLGVAQIHFADAKRTVDEVKTLVCAAPITDDAIPVDWAEGEVLGLSADELEKSGDPRASYAPVPAAGMMAKSYAAWQKGLALWLYQTQSLSLLEGATLKERSLPGESERDFRLRLQQKAREQRDAATEALRRKYAPKQAVLEEKLRRAQQKLEKEREEAQAQTLNSVMSIGSSILGAFLGRKTFSAANASRLSTAARSATRIGKERGDVTMAEETISAVQAQMRELERQFQQDLQALTAGLDPSSLELHKIELKPKKTAIQVLLIALGWR